MLSPARKLAPRLEAVVLRLLACLAFLSCASVELVAHANAAGTSAIVEAEAAGHRHALRASDPAGVERLHADALPADDLSAAEPEAREKDATLEAITFRLSTRSTPIVRFAIPAPRIVRATWWRPQPVTCVAMAQGPP